MRMKLGCVFVFVFVFADINVKNGQGILIVDDSKRFTEALRKKRFASSNQDK